MLRLLFHALASLPLCGLFWLVYTKNLGPDPAKKLALETGEWTFIFLLLTLALSSTARLYQPARRWVTYRRLLGLWTFFYASLHMLVFEAMYLGFDPGQLLLEFQDRPYISAGGLGWFVLLTLAVTSSNRARKRLGALRWKRLHRLVYLALVSAVIHVAWQVRSDWFEALAYGLAALALLAERAWFWRSKTDQPARSV
jgi:sulfoxide reductase heme-binding subunit YedZ